MFFSARRLSVTAPMIAIALLLLTSAATPAVADSYSMTTVGLPQGLSFYGMDDAGDYVLSITSHSSSTCGGVAMSLGSNCFETVYAGQSTPVFSTTPTSLAFDDGSSCSISAPTGFSISSAICNNGHLLFSGQYDLDGTVLTGTWSGFNPVTDYLGDMYLGGGFINGNGDAVFTDSIGNTLIYADNQTPPSYQFEASKASTTDPVPEPGTLLLVGTGALSLLTTVRRKLRS
jgi:hypothetical protein